jgi:hypothetical protein
MADNVLTFDEREYLMANAKEVIMMANEQWSGHMPMDKREVYQTIFLKSGGRQAICWTCGGSLKQLGKRLQQWL